MRWRETPSTASADDSADAYLLFPFGAEALLGDMAVEIAGAVEEKEARKKRIL